MDTHISMPSRVHATERRDAAATDERITYFAFWYFVISLLLGVVATSWVVLTI